MHFDLLAYRNTNKDMAMNSIIILWLCEHDIFKPIMLTLHGDTGRIALHVLGLQFKYIKCADTKIVRSLEKVQSTIACLNKKCRCAWASLFYNAMLKQYLLYSVYFILTWGYLFIQQAHGNCHLDREKAWTHKPAKKTCIDKTVTTNYN